MANELKFQNRVEFLNGVTYLNGIPFTLPVAAADPGSPVTGDVYYNTVSNTIKYYNGTTWNDLATGGAAANTALSNLAATAVNADLKPGADSTINLGSASFRWANLFTDQVDAGAGVLTLNGTNVSLNSKQIKNLAAGTLATDGVNLGQVLLRDGSNAATADQNLGGFKITNLGAPGVGTDATNKTYVDAAIAAATLSPLTNFIYVDAAGNDSTGNGSIQRPYLTIQKAADVVGAATTNAEFNDVTKRYYMIKASSGVFTENVTFGTRPFVILDMESAVLQGNLTVQFNIGGISGAGLQTPKFILKGDDVRGIAGGVANSGINGNLIYESIGGGSSLVALLQIVRAGISGNITQQLGAGGGVFTLTNLISSSTIAGTISSSGAGSMSLYVDNCDDSSTNAIGAVNGAINLVALSDVRFNGPVTIALAQSGRWHDVEFKSGQAHNFTGSSGTIAMDANTFESYQANVPTKGTEVANKLDTARGVKYPPATPANWSSVPTEVADALDTLAADSQGFVKLNGTRTFTANQPMGGFKFTGLGAGTVAGDSVRYEQAILTSGANAWLANQPVGGFKFTNLAAGTTAGDSVRYEQVILANGTNAFTANQSFGGFKATNMADPTTAQDGATKAYVDAVAQGLRPKMAVEAGTVANVNLASMPASIDGVTLVSGDRILVKNQTLPQDNGIYIFNGTGSAATRSTDMDSLSPIDEINGAYTFIQEGTQAGQGWVEQSDITVLGTDPMVWVWFNSAAAIIGGDMITVVGQTISVDLATASGLESTNPGNNAGQLRIKLETSNPSLKFTGSNELAVKLDPAGAITSGTSGLIVGVDNSTIEINSNALRVKALGITNSQIANATIDLTTKVTGILPIVNGGTNNSTYTSGSIIYFDGTKLAEDNSGLFYDAATKRLFMGQASSIAGSNAGIQFSNADTANRGQIKLHSYFNGTSVAGVSTLTSRSGTIGTNAAVVNGQEYSKWTAQAGATTAGSAPISGTWAFLANTVNSLTVASDFRIQLTNLAGTLADRFFLGSEGALRLPNYTTGIAHFDSSGNITSSAVNVSGADITGILAATSFPALTGDVTTTAGSLSTTISNLAVTNAKIANATIDLTTKVTGILPFGNGGTGQSSYTDGQLLIGNTATTGLTKSTLTAGSGVSIVNGNGSITISATGSGGTVTTVSVVSANGFAGTVANPTSTPAITISTTITGLLKGNGTAISAAVSGVDYQPAGNYITALTGDATATGPGSVALTLATVNGNVGTFGTATQVGTFTVNAKGLITAASNTSIQIAESQVTNLVSDLAAKLSNSLATNHIFVGSAGGVATDVAMSGEASIVASGAVTLSNAAVIAKVLTGYVSGAGTITAADSILTAIQKLNGNDGNFATKALDNLAAVAINTSLLAGTDNSIDLGSAAKRWANVHALNHLVYGSTSGAITLAAANTTTSYTVKWPNAQGAASTYLQNDGAGNLSWTAVTGFANTALSNLAAVAINTSLLPGTDNSIDVGSAAKRWANVHTLNALLYGSTSGAITLAAANTTTSYTVKWPNAQGAASTVLQNDGAGNLSWAASSAFVSRAGQQSIGNASTSQAITFTSTLGTTNYGISVTMKNITDANPQFQPLEITAKSATGVTVTWNANTDSANYVLEYVAILNA